MLIKMENNHETLRMPELRSLVRGSGLRNYSQLRKAELIALLRDNECRAQRLQRPTQMSSTWEPQREPEQPEMEVPLTKRQLMQAK